MSNADRFNRKIDLYEANIKDTHDERLELAQKNTRVSMPIGFVIISTLGLAVIWSIPVLVIGLKMRRDEVPAKNFLILSKVLFWMVTIISLIAQIEYETGFNQTLADPSLRAQWMAFLWPLGFASSLGGFFVKSNRKEHLLAAGKLLLSFVFLIIQVTRLMG